MKIIRNIAIFLAFAVLAFVVAPTQAKEKIIDRGPLSKITFIHYRKGFRPADLPTSKSAEAKPPWAGGGKDKGESSCYTFLSKGARWRTTENVVINPTNLDGLSKSFIQSTFDKSLETWDSEVDFDIFGATSLDPEATIPDSYDGWNVALFDTYSDPRVIAVTTIWGYFYGNPATRELVEWDMLFNEDFQWGDSSISGTLVMDFENIATHELGHSAGLGDLYESTCIDETMYGYSNYGETSKRDLNAGDLVGITKLYE